MENTYSGRQPQGVTTQAKGILEEGEINPPSAFQAYVDRSSETSIASGSLWSRRRPNHSTYTGSSLGLSRKSPKVSQATKKSKTPNRRVLNGVTYEVRKGSITNYEGTAIVNAANEQNLGGGGVDGAITSAGGLSLSKAREKMSNIWGNVKVRTGDARTTIAGELPCQFVIHAVGPNLSVEPNDIDLLCSTYISSISEAYRYNIKDLAFPIISGGIFKGGYSLKTIVDKAFDALVGNEQDIEKIVFYGYSESDVKILLKKLNSF